MKELRGKFKCLRQNVEKYKTLPVPIAKRVSRIVKNEKEATKTISYKFQFIDSPRFMANSSKIVDNLAEGIHKIKCNDKHNFAKCKMCEIKCNDCECCHML